MQNKLNQLQDILKVKFNNIDLLLQAITHKSSDPKNNYEKFEFLGDRVLGLIISEKLLDLYPSEKVGVLDKKFATLVKKEKCLEVGKSLNINKFVIVGNISKKNYKIENKIISDCCESIIGAIFIDRGYEVSKNFILNNWGDFLKLSNITIVDSKTKLQEYSLKLLKTLPIYKLISNTGPRHKPNFKVGVKLKNTKFIYAIGNSKKNAEQLAAKSLLKVLIK